MIFTNVFLKRFNFVPMHLAGSQEPLLVKFADGGPKKAKQSQGKGCVLVMNS